MARHPTRVIIYLAIATLLALRLFRATVQVTDPSSLHSSLQDEDSSFSFAVAKPAPPNASSNTRFDAPIKNQTLQTLDFTEFKSSVDYYGCCGAGHRITKMANAFYLARHLNFTLRAFWGFCDSIELYHYLFGEQPKHEIEHVTSMNQVFAIHNEPPGFKKLIREGPDADCKCSQKFIQETFTFYKGLRERFIARNEVDAFRDRYFTNYTVMGMHIRAGNGEEGDFHNRGRDIHNTDAWIRNMTQHVLSLRPHWKKPPRLFVATDTASMVGRFQSALNDTMDVIALDQERVDEGTGVMFGLRGKVLNEGEQCLQGWEDAFMDMMLLSHADIVLAARPSSFIQSLPMTMALMRSREERTVAQPFCDFNLAGTAMQCYTDYEEWCCTGNTSFIITGVHQRHDYFRVPYNVEEANIVPHERPGNLQDCIPRPRVSNRKHKCLPYDYPDQMEYHKRTAYMGETADGH